MTYVATMQSHLCFPEINMADYTFLPMTPTYVEPSTVEARLEWDLLWDELPDFRKAAIYEDILTHLAILQDSAGGEIFELLIYLAIIFIILWATSAVFWGGQRLNWCQYGSHYLEVVVEKILEANCHFHYAIKHMAA